MFNLGTGRAQPFNEVAQRHRQRLPRARAASRALTLEQLVAKRLD